MSTDPDTTPLRPAGKKTPSLSDVEVKTPQQHYMINSSGFYGHQQYTDLALLLKKNLFK